ncbi:MAG: hypothetical protein RR681_07885 [Lachnospiraceae bacterium]
MTNTYVNEDNSISLVMTKEQYKQNIEDIEARVNKKIEEGKSKGIIVDINSDINEICYTIVDTSQVSMLAWGMYEVFFRGNLYDAQVLMGKTEKECYIHEIVRVGVDKKKIADGVYPEEGYEITEEQWNGTKVQGE